ncbi:hypothetical protein [Polaribacter sp. R77954]|uniref:hypothetical protein n=1 Tax=Polaribacter sp. R77954 TaxID=3093870 RepID=UPI0037CC04E1
MSFFKKIKQKEFWQNTFKIAIPFFIFVTIISLLMNSWREIFAGDFIKLVEDNFSNGKWIQFWSYKVFLSLVYGMYMTNKNMK